MARPIYCDKMVYRTYRRRSFKRTYARRRRTTRAAAPRMMRRVAQRVFNNNLEKKYQDLAYSSTLSNSGTNFQKLTTISVGQLDSSNRIGDKVSLLSFKYRWDFATPNAQNYIRVIMFQWHPDDSLVAPTASLLLQQVSTTSFYNHDQGAQFSVIMDRQFVLNTNNPNKSIYGTVRFGSKLGRMKFVNKTVKYDSATTNGPDQLFILFISDNSSTPSPSVTGTSRLTYTDA